MVADVPPPAAPDIRSSLASLLTDERLAGLARQLNIDLSDPNVRNKVLVHLKNSLATMAPPPSGEANVSAQASNTITPYLARLALQRYREMSLL